MCLAIGAIVGLAGSALSAAGAMAQANAQANSAQYNAAVARINRDSARQQGFAEGERIGRRYDTVAGQQTAGYARGGVLPTSGSAAIVAGETARNRWLDTNTSIWNRETEAIGFDNRAQDLEAQARAIRQGGGIAAASTFLTGLGRAAGVRSGTPGTPLQIDSGLA